jgi:N-acetylneuraminic acid mutarotase
VFTPAATGTATITATSTQDTEKSGTATVTVGSATANNEWTWMSGSDTANPTGVYGILGVASTSNVPGARSSPANWTDRSGNLWLFGGFGVDSAGSTGSLNDLWEFNPSTKEWTWVSGSDTVNASGVYGTLGVAAANNVPGARNSTTSWVDTNGNLWLFGGSGNDSTGNGGFLNDLWEFSPSGKMWTWVSGSNTVYAFGIYGTVGVSAGSNVPGARVSCASWIDGSGNLWLFGGYGNATNGAQGNLNDLWEFSPTMNVWTWMSGSDGVGLNDSGEPGIYGTQGTPSASNVPGGRSAAVSWMDASGNLWLFGGLGADSTGSGTEGYLNDLWEFSPTSKMWTWMSGSDTANATGVYGTVGVTSASNIPGGREGAVGWIDSSGNLWLFGGDSEGPNSEVFLNDLWRFSPDSKQWTWMSGSSTVNAGGVYGSLGVPSVNNVPGARSGAIGWLDESGNLWIFGGSLPVPTGGSLPANDLWRYQP